MVREFEIDASAADKLNAQPDHESADGEADRIDGDSSPARGG